MITLHQKKS